MTAGTRLALRWLLYVAAAGVIMMAVAVGLLRLLLPQAPAYQDNIRAWASAATGYDIRFRRISASWPLAGPQLSFYEVSLTRPGETAAVLSARELTAGMSVLRTLRERRPVLAHVVIAGARVGVERRPGGELLVQGRRIEDLLPRTPPERREEIAVELADIAITYSDSERNPAQVALVLDSLRGGLNPERLWAKSQFTLPERFGRQLAVDVNVPLPLPSPLAAPASWDVRVSGTGVDLPGLLGYAGVNPAFLRTALGDATLELRVRDSRPNRVGVQAALRNVAIDTATGAAAYQGLSGRLVWTRSSAGWDAALEDLRLRRGDREWPAAKAELHYRAGGEMTAERWSGGANFIRLEDLLPFVTAALAGTEREATLPRLASGDLRDIVGEYAREAQKPPKYALRMAFGQLAVTSATGDVALEGLTGTVAADGDGGRLQLESSDVALYLGQWFRDTLRAQTLKGLLVWRAGPDGVHLLSDDISLKSAVIDVRSRLELRLPADGSSPVIDLKASASATEAREVLRYLPLRRFPPKVVDWLERAVVAGRVPQATVEFRGPLREFPYERDEGTFKAVVGLEDATLDYADGWPRIEDIQAEVVFDGVSMYSTTNRARLGALQVHDYTVRIADLREGVLALSGGQRVSVEDILNFVRATPLAKAIGPTLDRVTGTGPVDAALRLALPIKEVAGYDLKVLFDARGCELGLQRVPLDLTELRGRIRLENTRFYGKGLQAVMLGEPVEVSLRPDTSAGSLTSHIADFRGATPVARVMSTFGLPLREYFDGSVSWQATARVPVRREHGGAPLTVSVVSDLTGMASRLPPPLTKAAETPWPATIEVSFPASDFIDVTGHTNPPFAWALRLASTNGGWRVDRGMLLAGPGDPRLPPRRGMELAGHIARLRLADWLNLGSDGNGRAFRELYRDASLQIDRLTVAGQVFPDVNAVARRGADGWTVAVTGPRAAGKVEVPFDLTARPLVLDMKRLWLLEAEEGVGDRTDPREVMAAEVKAEDAAIGAWRFGRLEMSVAKTPDGLTASRIATQASSFAVAGDGAWEVEGGDPVHQHTRLHATLNSTEVKDTLEQLGFDPVMSGKEMHVGVDLIWPDGPSSDFLARASGKISVDVRKGQVLELEPGSGRFLGLLSVTALPRRLALDFHDVFNQGLAFDSIKGNFRVGGGSAYTCNLGLSGPAADIAMVGRTAFAEHTYDQLAVVRPQVSNVLAVGGLALGGPVGGATMLLIEQLFRKPLSTLGESYYRVSGGWDKPDVVRVQRGDVDTAAFKDCEQEVTAALEAAQDAAPPEAPATAAPGEPQ